MRTSYFLLLISSLLTATLDGYGARASTKWLVGADTFKIMKDEINLYEIDWQLDTVACGQFSFSMSGKFPEGMKYNKDEGLSWYPAQAQFDELTLNPQKVMLLAQSDSCEVYKKEIILIAGQEKEPLETEKFVQNSLPLEIVLPEGAEWQTAEEGASFNFKVSAKGGSGHSYLYSISYEEDTLDIIIDKKGQFYWVPPYSFVPQDSKEREIDIFLVVSDLDGNSVSRQIQLTVLNVNRPPKIHQLPVFYIGYNKKNTYVLNKKDFIYDEDGDIVTFEPVLSTLPQGMNITPEGVVTWAPSVGQFRKLQQKEMVVGFVANDNFGASSVGNVKVAVSMEDLPPELTMVPKLEHIDLKENEPLNLKFYITDPNGNDDILAFDFVSTNPDIAASALKKVTPTQYEFLWVPSYGFVQKEGGEREFKIDFFAIDKENHKTNKSLQVKINDAENVFEKDKILYEQFRSLMMEAWNMVEQLNEKEDELQKNYKVSRRGKKTRAIFNAGLGAITGLSALLPDETTSDLTTGIGGTATATMTTLEASDALGQNPSQLMESLSYAVLKKNDIISSGNVLAGKYTSRIDRRKATFQNDLNNFAIKLNLQDVSKLKLDAAWKNSKKSTINNMKKVFKDFVSDEEFEGLISDK